MKYGIADNLDTMDIEALKFEKVYGFPYLFRVVLSIKNNWSREIVFRKIKAE